MLQVFPFVLLDVKVTLSPAQNVNGPLALIVGVVGLDVTVTTTLTGEDGQPLPSSAVKVYVPDAFTVIVCVVSPVLQVLPVVLDDVNVVVCPAQMFNPLSVMFGVAVVGFTVMLVFAELAEHPFISLTVTE